MASTAANSAFTYPDSDTGAVCLGAHNPLQINGTLFSHEEGMREFRQYRRKQIAELRPYEPGEDINGVSISAPDKEAGSPKAGDMIGRNPKNHADKWLVAAQYFADNFEPL
ncbi:MAG: hypothetical protein WBA14_23570 [Pseudolabrys sp.]|jgi:hypothetical protein